MRSGLLLRLTAGAEFEPTVQGFAKAYPFSLNTVHRTVLLVLRIVARTLRVMSTRFQRRDVSAPLPFYNVDFHPGPLVLLLQLEDALLIGREIPRMTRSRSLTPKRAKQREARIIKALWPKGAGKMVESTGSGYLPPHQASLVSMAAEVRYAAGIDSGMIPMQG